MKNTKTNFCQHLHMYQNVFKFVHDTVIVWEKMKKTTRRKAKSTVWRYKKLNQTKIKKSEYDEDPKEENELLGKTKIQEIFKFVYDELIIRIKKMNEPQEERQNQHN